MLVFIDLVTCFPCKFGNVQFDRNRKMAGSVNDGHPSMNLSIKLDSFLTHMVGSFCYGWQNVQNPRAETRLVRRLLSSIYSIMQGKTNLQQSKTKGMNKADYHDLRQGPEEQRNTAKTPRQNNQT